MGKISKKKSKKKKSQTLPLCYMLYAKKKKQKKDFFQKKIYIYQQIFFWSIIYFPLTWQVWISITLQIKSNINIPQRQKKSHKHSLCVMLYAFAYF